MRRTIQILLFIFCVSISVAAQQKAVAVTRTLMPEIFIGNWVNVNTNNWEYGFFEKVTDEKCSFGKVK